MLLTHVLVPCRVNPAVPEPQALCMCPTRELVVQNLLVLQRMAKYTGIKATSTASDMPKGIKIREQVSGDDPFRVFFSGKQLKDD